MKGDPCGRGKGRKVNGYKPGTRGERKRRVREAKRARYA